MNHHFYNNEWFPYSDPNAGAVAGGGVPQDARNPRVERIQSNNYYFGSGYFQGDMNQNNSELLDSFVQLLEQKSKYHHRYFLFYSVCYHLILALIFLASITISILSYLAQKDNYLSLKTASIINGVLGLVITALHSIVTQFNLDSKRESYLWKRDYLVKLKHKVVIKKHYLLTYSRAQLLKYINSHLDKLEQFNRSGGVNLVLNQNNLRSDLSSLNQIAQVSDVSPISSLKEDFLDYLYSRRRASTKSFYFVSGLLYPVILIVYLLSLAVSVLSFLIVSDVFPDENEALGVAAGIVSIFVGAGNQFLNWAQLDVKRQNYVIQRQTCQKIWDKVYFLDQSQYNLAKYIKLIDHYYGKLGRVTKHRPLSFFQYGKETIRLTQ